MRTQILGLWITCVAIPVNAGTELDFWHSYTHQPSGKSHYSFHIANYKRGLFFGPCGPSTRSVQWEYDVDLTDNGPVYQKDQIAIKAEGKPFAVAAGTISIDAKQQNAKIDLQIGRDGTTTNFVGNGTWRIKKIE
jgi:hypothetical protein